ncbi:hypothetical protein BJ165DRAFT_1613435 [Panaeolus papilionaceus]|nr:hypothetical protein BJ165DRAFT_1613435 [Panaeolus papilionaceus]
MSSSNTANTVSKAIARPGLGLPLNHYDKYNNTRFPNALNAEDLGGHRATMSLLTLRELTMLQIMQQITTKPNWDTKVFNEEIKTRWTDEALAVSNDNGIDVSPRMMIYIVEELQHKANGFKETSYFTAYDLTTISDCALSDAFREELSEAVLDLVHPSLFPLVYGRTRVLDDGERVKLEDTVRFCGKGSVIPVPAHEEIRANTYYGHWSLSRSVYSTKFQWLPCEVDISGNNAKVTSYINNLHPVTHKPLYGLIEKVIDACIPLWNSTLSLVFQQNEIPRRIFYNGDYEIDNVADVVLPEPNPFQPTKRVLKTNLREQFGSSGLQVIVKLANIELSPEKPEYGGGSWHLEGQLNEHICATSIYYYSNENITPSTLSFRQQVDTSTAGEVEYQQDFHDWLPLVYGVSQGGAGVQVLGGVATPQNRLLMFPNVLQHQVQPFKLADPTKKGHRKILALFLVDPTIKIISTANVPRQRVDWWKDETYSVPSGLDKLPVELKEEVFRGVEDFPIGLEEAKELRLELMEERKKFEVKQSHTFHSLEFSLCEH